jgi:hypothetical protein
MIDHWQCFAWAALACSVSCFVGYRIGWAESTQFHAEISRANF